MIIDSAGSTAEFLILPVKDPGQPEAIPESEPFEPKDRMNSELTSRFKSLILNGSKCRYYNHDFRN